MRHGRRNRGSASGLDGNTRHLSSRGGHAPMSAEAIRAVNSALGRRTEIRNNYEIPAGYTYLAQFVAHDVGFHSFAQGSALPTSLAPSPLLDLSSLYGPGPAAAPHLYVPVRMTDLRWRLKLGDSRGSPESVTLPTPRRCQARANAAFDAFAPRGLQNDLPRCALGLREKGRAHEYDGTAVVADPRNDEQMIVSQLTVLLCRLHNSICDRLEGQKVRRDSIFPTARSMTVHCYHQIVLRDLLCRLLDTAVYRRLLPHFDSRSSGSAGLCTPGALQMVMAGADAPPEFWAAAFRFGHAMIQEHYDYNRHHTMALIVPELIGLMETGSMNGPPIADDWIIDWDRFFFEKRDAAKPQNFSHPIGLSFARQLADPARWQFRDEHRGIGGVPALDVSRIPIVTDSAQAYIARLPEAAGIRPLPTERISQACGMLEGHYPDFDGLVTDTPIYIYVLAEAEICHGGSRLGPLGSLIVGEVLLAAMRLGRTSAPGQAADEWALHFPGVRVPASMPMLLRFLPGSPGISTMAGKEED